MAFGEIGFTPDEFYSMEIEDGVLAYLGYIDKRRDDAKMFRRVATIMANCFSGRITEHELWPIAGDETKPKIGDLQLKQLAKFREQKNKSENK